MLKDTKWFLIIHLCSNQHSLTTFYNTVHFLGQVQYHISLFSDTVSWIYHAENPKMDFFYHGNNVPYYRKLKRYEIKVLEINIT